jgi:hypothetical protein
VCLDNHGYPVALERGKLYPVLDDAQAAELGLLRIVDESGEGYLYSASRFAAIAVPDAIAIQLAA